MHVLIDVFLSGNGVSLIVEEYGVGSGCNMSPDQARALAAVLVSNADQAEED